MVTYAIFRVPLAILAAFACAASGPSLEAQPLHRQARRIMGSLAEIKVHHPDAVAAARAMAAALDEMARVDALLSPYKPESEVSRMNARAAREPFRASRELFDFVRSCRRYFDETRGTFDPTMGPVVRAWGFFTRRPAVPDPEARAAARARAGFDKVRLDDTARTIAYSVEGVELDPGGIGKGYAADRAATVLRELGVSSALVSAGGSTIAAVGHPPGQNGWKVAVRDPSNPAASLRFVWLRDNAVSTSGLSEQFVNVDGRRYGHIIDPRTGDPAEGMCQVSVVAKNATDSDALTKAAYLLSRDTLVTMYGRRQDLHILRVEGPCKEPDTVWVTPWSAGVFAADAAPARVPAPKE